MCGSTGSRTDWRDTLEEAVSSKDDHTLASHSTDLLCTTIATCGLGAAAAPSVQCCLLQWVGPGSPVSEGVGRSVALGWLTGRLQDTLYCYYYCCCCCHRCCCCYTTAAAGVPTNGSGLSPSGSRWGSTSTSTSMPVLPSPLLQQIPARLMGPARP